MAWYKVSKLGFNITHKALFRNPQTIINHTNHSSKFTYTVSGYRYYHVDRHYKDNVATFSSIVMYLGLCSGVVLCLGHSETIPYSKRKHFMLISGRIERWVGKYSFKKMKYEYEYKGNVLPDTHPISVRVRTILKDVTEALQTGLNKQDLNCGNDKRVKLGILHAKGFEWEVMVVKSNVVNACCLPGGKIIVFTGLLKHFKTDEELATIIGHEVAHAVARHAAEMFTKFICFTIGRVILDEYIRPDVVSRSYIYLLNLPFSRKMESEADYIGMMLMASAGYNPRVAPKVFEKLDEGSGDSALKHYVSTHPSGKKRSKLLSEASVMQEAISIYEEAIARPQVDT